ncbi:MAG TPA: tetratricopeptide repeat protein [Candidatus Obscuribacterales bacterium]
MVNKQTISMMAIAATVSLCLPALATSRSSSGVTSLSDLQSLAQHGDGDAICQLADCYQQGKGVEKDEAKADELYTKAAFMATHLRVADADLIAQVKDRSLVLKSNQAKDKFIAGLIYRDGAGVDKDDKQAAACFAAAAEQLPEAQNALAMLYESGSGVERDMHRAVELFKSAADSGCVAAQNNLGALFYKGEGVAKDSAKAAKLFQAAADHGDVNAMSNLGWMYQHGLGVDRDYKKAAHYFTVAAAHGLTAARYNLGYLYQYGLGVEKDYAKNSKLYSLSAIEDGQQRKLLGHEWEGSSLEFKPGMTMRGINEPTEKPSIALRKLFL